MTASKERVKCWMENDIDELEDKINQFIIEDVSKVIDLRINNITDTHYYAYLRYIPQ